MLFRSAEQPGGSCIKVSQTPCRYSGKARKCVDASFSSLQCCSGVSARDEWSGKEGERGDNTGPGGDQGDETIKRGEDGGIERVGTGLAGAGRGARSGERREEGEREGAKEAKFPSAEDLGRQRRSSSRSTSRRSSSHWRG